MAGWPDLATDGDGLAQDIKARTRSVKADYTNWRATINTTSGTGGLLAALNYQSMAAYRTFMAASVAANASGIAAAYIRRNPALAGFDPAARWAELLVAIDSFLDWFQTNWPKKAATGEPAFQAFNGGKELSDLTVTFGAPAKTAILARLDAIIAALPAS